MLFNITNNIAYLSMFKSDIIKFERLGNAVRENSHLFFKNLGLVFDYLRLLDKLNPFEINLTEIYEIISYDPSLFNEMLDLAWPYQEDEWKKGSIYNIENENTSYNATFIASNILNLSNEFIPPFKIYEVSIYKEKGNEIKLNNAFSIKVQDKNSSPELINRNKEISSYDITEIHSMIINEINSNINDYINEELNLIFVDFSLTCQEAFDMQKKDYDIIFESLQNLLSITRSYNIVPVSIYNSNTSPLLFALIKYLEKYEKKILAEPSLLKEMLLYINDKLFLSGKLNKFHRSPLLNYTNFIFEENPYLREKIAIFYVKFDLNTVKRIEVPIYAESYIDIIHKILIQQYKKNKANGNDIYSFTKAKKNLVTEKRNKEKIIKYIDSILRKESAKVLGKEMGIIKGIY